MNAEPVAVSESSGAWHTAYAAALGELPVIVERARPIFCGLSVCVDATISLHDAGVLLDVCEPPEAVALAATLRERAAAGIGGEIRVDWPNGPRWLDGRLPFRHELGGTAAHAARVLTVLGAPAVLALEVRSPEQLAVLDADIRVADGGRLERAGELIPTRPNAVKVYIFEYTKGRAVGGTVLGRSSRVIVRFDDPGLQNDEAFDALSTGLLHRAGAALISGFNTVGADLDQPLARARELATRWFAAGVPVVHLELANYEFPAYRDRAIAGLTGSITSLGMSYSEYQALQPHGALADELVGLGTRMGLRRVCVHADGWAASATLDDPKIERTALLVGCLLASARAEDGRPIVPAALPADAAFEDAPIASGSIGAWHIVSCAAPYLARPVTTLGLGDTFTAGCLLVLGAR